MLWLLFILLGLVIILIGLTLPYQAAMAYAITILWIMLLIYAVFYRKDDVSEEIDKIGGG